MFIFELIANLIGYFFEYIFDLLVAGMALWLLIIATQLISAQNKLSPKDDVQEDWAEIRYLMRLHIRAMNKRLKTTKTTKKLRQTSKIK